MTITTKTGKKINGSKTRNTKRRKRELRRPVDSGIAAIVRQKTNGYGANIETAELIGITESELSRLKYGLAKPSVLEKVKLFFNLK